MVKKTPEQAVKIDTNKGNKLDIRPQKEEVFYNYSENGYICNCELKKRWEDDNRKSDI